MDGAGRIILAARGISVQFGATRALDGVDLALRAGEVHALLGQNGAGKSTLIRVISGACRPDAGTLELEGREVRPRTPAEAQQLGISTVFQEVNLCPNLTVAENMYAGRYPRRPWHAGGGIDWKRLNEQAQSQVEALGLRIDVRRQLSAFPVAIRQMVAIARATCTEARVLILDEPTSSLDEQEVAQLFALVRRLRAQGMAVLFVTHFLDQVYALCDRMTVLRNGRRVGEYLTSELDRAGLLAAMVGREFDPAARPAAAAPPVDAPRAPVVELKQVARRGCLHPLDLSLRRGEILGVAGLLGSGRTELARLLFGMDRHDSGTLLVEGQEVRLRTPADAIALGVAYCPEERKSEGLVLELSVRENIILALQARAGLKRALSPREQRELVARLIESLGIRAADMEMPVGQLSGGNQQKVLIARWLAISPRVLLLDEPTRGIDVAAREEILRQIATLAGEGMAVLFISAEIAEVLRESARIVVLRERRKVGELPGGSGEQAVYALIAEHAAA
jgi:monosaccharide-transporting ATPase|nr:MAG: sugar ABC transporter ATP-binding protein [Pseudomonadota bacterium]